MENYKFIADKEEIRWFFDHVLEDLSGDSKRSYLACLCARPKKLSDDERKKYGIGNDAVIFREEIISPRGKNKIWNFDQFISHFYRYECPKEGVITRTGLPYPEKSLSVLFYVEPSDETKVAQYIVKYANTIQSELVESTLNFIKNGVKAGVEDNLNKLSCLTKKVKTCHAENTVKTFIHYDFDVAGEYVNNEIIRQAMEDDLKMILMLIYGKGNFFIIKTAGGYHVLVSRKALKEAAERCKKYYGNSNPIQAFLNALENTDSASYFTVGEDRVQKQCFVPMPGVLMYGSYIPTIINKEDFS